MAVARSTRSYLLNQRRLWRDAALDRKFGIDTCGYHDDLEDVGARGDNRAHGYAYEPTQIGVFPKIMRALPDCTETHTFVDFGSGKGRALILAAEAGFKTVIGVEFARSLNDIAQRNIEIYRRKSSGESTITTYCMDVTAWPIPLTNAVFYFYNPFDDVVMQALLARIEQSWVSFPRDLIIVYRTPRHESIFASAPFLQRIYACEPFRIYRTAGCR